MNLDVSASPFRTLGRLGRVLLGLLCAIFVVSAVLSFADVEAAQEVHRRLDFPAALVVPLAVAKLAAVAAIVWGGSRTLMHFAFAGLFYDLVLALHGHIENREADSLLAAAALAVWIGAFAAVERVQRAAH